MDLFLENIKDKPEVRIAFEDKGFRFNEILKAKGTIFPTAPQVVFNGATTAMINILKSIEKSNQLGTGTQTIIAMRPVNVNYIRSNIRIRVRPKRSIITKVYFDIPSSGGRIVYADRHFKENNTGELLSALSELLKIAFEGCQDLPTRPIYISIHTFGATDSVFGVRLDSSLRSTMPLESLIIRLYAMPSESQIQRISEFKDRVRLHENLLKEENVVKIFAKNFIDDKDLRNLVNNVALFLVSASGNAEYAIRQRQLHDLETISYNLETRGYVWVTSSVLATMTLERALNKRDVSIIPILYDLPKDYEPEEITVITITEDIYVERNNRIIQDIAELYGVSRDRVNHISIGTPYPIKENHLILFPVERNYVLKAVENIE